MSMREFEQYLKASDHFADVINTHRAATAEIIAGFAAMLQDSGIVSGAAIKVLLARLDEPTGRRSIDGSRRVLIARVGDALKARQ